MDQLVLTAFRAAANAAQGATSVDGYCQATIGHVASLLGTPRCSIVLRNVDRFHHAAAVGLSAEYCDRVDGLAVDEDLGSCGPAILTGETTVTADIAASEQWRPLWDITSADGLRACWSVPLRAGSDPALGSLGVYRDTPGLPTTEQLAAGEAIADVLALGIDAILRQRAVADGSEATVQALMAALDARDAYTAGHSAATTALAVAVGARLGLGHAELDVVARAAELHDIGKLAIPDAVLHFPHALDDAQTAVMRTHPVVGSEIVGHVPGLGAVARAVRHEHERWDGGGYPDGLAGERIPIASRIVFVCDAFHAMTSDRPYRKAMPVAAACAEMRRHAGTQFDPLVVEALLAELDGLGPDALSV